MNKKNLSVVMAGAMLATSVAPVLAAETTTTENSVKEYSVNNSNKGLLIKELRNLMNSKTYSNVTANGSYANESVYEIKVISSNGGTYTATDVTRMETLIKDTTDGDVVKVYDRGHVEKDGSIYAFDYVPAKAAKFTEEGLKDTADWFNGEGKYSQNNKANCPAVLSVSYEDGVLTVKTVVVKGTEESNRVVFKYKAGDDWVDIRHAINSKGEELSTIDNNSDLAGFAAHKEIPGYVPEQINGKIEETLLYKINISDADAVYNVKLSDVYDGLFLTTKGQQLIDTLKLYDANGWTVDSTFPINESSKGLYSIKIKFIKPVPSTTGKQIKNEVIVTTNNRAQLEVFAKGLEKQPSTEGATRKFPVQVLAGSNRYETAVKVAKENADITTVAENGNIVLVNGYSLVDGLAAAPLAASAQNKENTVDGQNYAAPILLTESNSIPKSTRDYIKEIIGEQQIKNLDKVTVYLVGGEAVISKSVENQLKDMGLRVVRAGGADREETSLKVAELMYKDGRPTQVNKDDAFLVGSDAEADAMSIASVAAATKTPIIVESRKGISDDTIDFLKGYKNDTTSLESKDVTIIGGKNAVSDETENTLKDEKIKVDRLAGDNRQQTNAKVIEAYYGVTGNTNGVLVNPGHKLNNVVVSKDGKGKETDLIDALTATSLAVRDYAPIVLGTKSLSKEQINALELNASGTGIYVYQVGLGVDSNVIKTLAEKIGLAK